MLTIYRHDAVSEKCPLGGLYVLTNGVGSTGNQENVQTDDRNYRNAAGTGTNSKCSSSDGNVKDDSMIMECSDSSMLKLQFGKCTNMPSNKFKSYFFFVNLFKIINQINSMLFKHLLFIVQHIGQKAIQII